MSSYHTLVAQLVKSSGCKTYLELGVRTGETFLLIVNTVQRAIGVDMRDIRMLKKGEFYMETTDDFFKHFTDPVDVVFIDAGHGYEFVKKDLLNSLPLLTKYGFIILHDTDPIGPELLECRGDGFSYCGDAYKVIDYIRENLPELDVTTLPIQNMGISLVARKDARRVLEFV